MFGRKNHCRLIPSFDGDPPEDCALLTSIVREAAGVPLALVLEGGYGPLGT